MKETQTVISNIIHDMKIINQKTEAGVWGLRNYIEYKGDGKEYNEWLKKKSEEYEQKRKEDERNKSIETSDKANSESDSKK